MWGTNYWFKHLVKLMKEEMQKAAGQSEQNQETKNKIEVMDKETQLVEESMKMWDRYGGWKLVHTELPHSVVGRMFQSTVKRVEISCPTETMVQRDPNANMLMEEKMKYYRPVHLWIKVKQMRMEEGAVGMAGIAPAGDLERKVQQYLDEVDPPAQK